MNFIKTYERFFHVFKVLDRKTLKKGSFIRNLFEL